jgi:electron transport complex protein RnfG
MKEIMRYGLILTIICGTAAGALAGVNTLTKAKIIAQARQEVVASLKEVLPDAGRFEEVKKGEEVLYYKAIGPQDKLIGFAFKASGKGYSSVIETIAGMLKDGTITAIKVVSQTETPGLGANVAGPEFTGRFKNIRDPGAVEAITGATISSRAVIDSVEKKASEIKVLIKDE